MLKLLVSIYLLLWVNCYCFNKLFPIKFSQEGIKSDCALFSVYPINGQTPVLNLSGHCDPSEQGCTYLGREIRDCQQKGIKVLISIGGPTGDYNLTSRDDVT